MNINMPTSLAGERYQLGQLVGRGGMAEVHVATDTRLGRTVAVKIMRADFATDSIFLERFRREAHSVAQMNNPNIVNIYDSGEETVTTETRYRTETRTGYYTDADGNLQSYEYDVQVPYTYYICTVELENFNLSHVPVYIMSQDQLSLYAMYMATLGNRPDLFGGSEYIGKYYIADYEKYEIPPEALEDAQFAAIIKEAEKYLGYP